jgi:GDP-D-mannose dehydratase
MLAYFRIMQIILEAEKGEDLVIEMGTATAVRYFVNMRFLNLEFPMMRRGFLLKIFYVN